MQFALAALKGGQQALAFQWMNRKTTATEPSHNHFVVPALTIAHLYKARWNVELLFKWIKQHLRIKKFYGYSANPVKTQIWIAISTYVLVAILKKQLSLPQSLYTILQILSLTLFEKIPILRVFQGLTCENEITGSAKQLILFD